MIVNVKEINANNTNRDILYDQPNNGTCCQKTESVRHNASFAITGAIQGIY